MHSRILLLSFTFSILLFSCNNSSNTNTIESETSTEKTNEQIDNKRLTESNINSSETNSSSQLMTFSMYNLENLFDTTDDPNTLDDDFSPTGENKWDTKRYEKKLLDLSKIIAEIGDADGPEAFGVSEIENRKVLEDLVATPLLQDRGYKVAHIESTDRRGIDVALIYKESAFQINKIEQIPLKKPDGRKAREALLVQAEKNGKVVYFVVCHMPSRREGQEESEPNRLAVSQSLRQFIDKSIFSKDPSANLILLGDFNDTPSDLSLTQELKANASPDYSKNELFNCAATFEKQGKGTYRYKGEWMMIDHILISEMVMKGENGVKFENSGIFQKEWMVEPSGKFKGNPFRTYAGPKYLGGYSDHLPFYIQCQW